MKRLPSLNQTQLKSVADLLLDLGKWLLITIVLGAIFSPQIKETNPEKSVIIGLILSMLLIIYAIWLLREVKDK